MTCVILKVIIQTNKELTNASILFFFFFLLLLLFFFFIYLSEAERAQAGRQQAEQAEGETGSLPNKDPEAVLYARTLRS